MIPKLKPGDRKIPSAGWNAMADRFNAGMIGGSDQRLAIPSNPVVVKVFNNTGVALRRRYVVGLGDAHIDLATSPNEWKNELILKAETPTTAGHFDRFGIVTDFIDVDCYGDAMLFGATQVALYVNSANDIRASVKNNDRTQLSTDNVGPARILWKESGTGAKQGIVLLNDPFGGVYLGKTDSAISKGSSGTVSRYYRNAGVKTDTTQNDTVENNFADIESGAWIAYTKIDGVYVAIAAECEVA